jgi:hypothetical protein
MAQGFQPMHHLYKLGMQTVLRPAGRPECVHRAAHSTSTRAILVTPQPGARATQWLCLQKVDREPVPLLGFLLHASSKCRVELQSSVAQSTRRLIDRLQSPLKVNNCHPSMRFIAFPKGFKLLTEVLRASVPGPTTYY